MGEFNCYHGSFKSIQVFDDNYSGDTTGNNDHNSFFFSSEKCVAEDYAEASIVRRYEGLSVDDLMACHGFSEEEAILVNEDVHSYACDKGFVMTARVTLNNPYILDLDGEMIDCVKIQKIIGHLKGVEYYEELFYDIIDEPVCDCDEEDGCYCEQPEYDGLIIKNCVDNIGDRSHVVMDEIVAFHSHQITVIGQYIF